MDNKGKGNGEGETFLMDKNYRSRWLEKGSRTARLLGIQCRDLGPLNANGKIIVHPEWGFKKNTSR